MPKSLGKRLAGALGGNGWLVPTGHESGSCRWEKAKGRLKKESADGTPSDQEAALIEGLEEEMLERSGEVLVFFRDPSGVVLPADLWYPSKTFWSIVKAKTISTLFA